LLRAMLPSVPAPEFAVDTNGEVEFDWIFETPKMFSLIISAAGRITFAWTDGVDRGRGTVWFNGAFPANIALALAQLCPAQETTPAWAY
ncbi:MAG: hypothetical protein ACREIC_04985, partial [Limisphaerales bacterium]